MLLSGGKNMVVAILAAFFIVSVQVLVPSQGQEHEPITDYISI